MKCMSVLAFKTYYIIVLTLVMHCTKNNPWIISFTRYLASFFTAYPLFECHYLS